MTVSHFTTTQNRRLAFRQHKAAPGKASFVWLCGFKSDMTGSKVTLLEAWAREAGHGFLAFDYSGHGQSDGDFKNGTISAWREDMLAAIDALTEGPQILVGSSMGGWMALLAAMARPERVAGLVLIAPAPDFTEKLMWPDLLPEEKKEILENGIYYQPSDYDEPLPLTKALFEDGKQWQIMDAPIAFSGPVRILQGMRDEPVPWQHAQRLVDVLTAEDLVFTLVKDGDHRLSRDEDIARLIATCGEIGGIV
jgi:pimeloyl-ACP methyl ester carboxylesterase